MRVGSGTWTLANLTVVGNTAPLGGGLYLEGGTATLHHAIVWGNFAVDAAGTPLGAQLYIANASASLPTVQFCDIANAANDVVDDGVKINGGDGFAAGQAANLSANPLFAQGPAGAYYLSQTAAGQTQPSPCVDPVNANALVAPLAAAAGFSTYPTRTDGIGDAGTLDLGWHYGP